MNPLNQIVSARTPARLWSLLAVAFIALTTQFVVAAGEAQAASPSWRVTVNSFPTNFAPGATNTGIFGYPLYRVIATNIGAADTSGPITFTDTLPAGITPNYAGTRTASAIGAPCDIAGQTVTCQVPSVVRAGTHVELSVEVTVGSLPEGSSVENTAFISGGGAPAAEGKATTNITSDPVAFGFADGAPGLGGSATDPNGAPVTQAGAHPYQVDVELTPSADQIGPSVLTGAGGGLRDLVTELPPGLVVNPNATPLRCTEAQLEISAVGCPRESQVGTVTITTAATGIQTTTSPLYNMETPAGVPALLGFDALGVGLFVHLAGGVRAGDYALTATANDILARNGNPVLGVHAQLWGNPTDNAHNPTRGGECGTNGGTGSNCNTPVPPRSNPFLTMPTSCSDTLELRARADSWQDPGNFIDRGGVFADALGNPTGVSGCGQVPFHPAIGLQPTNHEADSSSGMDVDLGIPQSDDFGTIASANLKKAVVTLPEGMALNPSAADGLEGCTEAQIGLTSESPIKFDASDAACPNGSKVGDGSIVTPLLPDPLDVDLYVADPDDNPFHSLLSGYLVAHGSGITIKLAARFDRDPDTGQITATVDNNPQLPFSDLHLHFKGGPRGVLITPPTCGIYEIESKLVPWSAVDPQNPTPAEVVTDTSTFTVDSAPGGGPCQAGDPSQPADQADRADRPFAPVMKAGVVTPNAGSSSPFVLRATRQDGEQEITSLNADLPPGLTAKLAGIPQCSEAAIASIPTAIGTGQGELNSPSCPAGSQLGTTQVGAGAGAASQLTYIPGKVYLAGPYKGAPLSLAIVTPAVTGPFDLGNVVIRTKLLIDQDDAQVHAISDPIPTILEGIPLHIRDIRVTMDRPGFIQTPTNCNPLSVTGSLGGGGGVLASTADDISAAVSNHFQVSGCAGLGFSPKLSGQILNGQDGIHRSDHPNLLFSLHGTPGDANLSRVEVLLPQNFQIDQANLGNICSETQLATQDCAGRQRIGTASATTPLLDTPLSGPVYAVSGSGGLPKLAVILYGPPSMPIKLVVRGITETVGARIKNTFPLVPDAPVSDFALNLDGGPQGYLVNNSDLCGSSKGKKSKKKKGKGKRSASAAKKKKGKKKSRSGATGIAADATFFGQNGDTLSQSVPISAECGTGGGGKKKGKKKRG